MSRTRQKGAGATTNSSITLAQRAPLFDWCKTHKDDKRPFVDLAKAATEELGFNVSVNCINNHWAAVNGLRHHPRENGGTLAAKLAALDARVAACERRLDVHEWLPLNVPKQA